jgi:hypothetical protein
MYRNRYLDGPIEIWLKPVRRSAYKLEARRDCLLELSVLFTVVFRSLLRDVDPKTAMSAD